MALIGRLFVIFFGFLAACLVAGIVVVTAVLFPDFSDLGAGPVDQSVIDILIGFGFIFISGFALLPAMIVALITEAFSIRSVLAYAIGGALVGVAGYLSLVPFDTDTLRFEGIVRRHMEIMTGAGIVAGLVYWMVAGRNAGAWRAPRRRSAASAALAVGLAPAAGLIVIARSEATKQSIAPQADPGGDLGFPCLVPSAKRSP